MYKTVREGDASLQYTLLAASAPVPRDDDLDDMTLRHVLSGRGAARGGVKRRVALCGMRSRPLVFIGAVLVLGCVAVLAAALMPVIASTADLESALQSALNFGGAGQRASVNPNVHHPASRPHPDRHEHRHRLEQDDDDDDERKDYPQGGQDIALVSAMEVPLPALNPVVRVVPTPRPSIRDDDEDEDEDDDDDDDDLGKAVGRVPAGLPPSLLPQRQPPGPAPPRAEKLPPLMLDPIMGDGARATRPHHKTNNGLYTNDDDVDHNILELTRRLSRPAVAPQRSVASTRIFVEALLPSIGGSDGAPGAPAAPQRRSSWMGDSFNWTDWRDFLVRKVAFGAGLGVGLFASLALVWAVRRRRSPRRSSSRTPPGTTTELQDAVSATCPVRREVKVDTSLGPDNTTRDLLGPQDICSSEEEA